MNEVREGDIQTIIEVAKRFIRKNKHLSDLRNLVLMLAETEDEASFVERVVPLLKEAIGAEETLFLFVRVGETVVSIPSGESTAMAAVYEQIKFSHGFKRDVIVVDFGAEEAGGSLGHCLPAGCRVCIFTPIHHRGEDMGFICLPARTATAPPGDELLFLKYVGEVMGVFFEYVRLKKELLCAKEEVETRYENLLAVYTVAKAMGTNQELKEVLERGLDAILGQKVLNVLGQGGIFILNEETNRLEMVCHRNIDDCLVQTEESIPLGHCLCGLAAESGEILVSEDCFADARHHAHYEGMTSHGHIIVPLKAKDRVLGVLFLYLPPDTKATARQLDMVEAIANQLSVSLENARLYDRVKHLSVHDPLTGLCNRNMLYERLEEETGRAARFGETLAVAMMDVDGFKQINDRFGHMVGDELLKQVALHLRKNVRRADVVARFGGDEFTILLPHANKHEAMAAMERITEYLRCHLAVKTSEGESVQVSMSIGVSFSTPGQRWEASQLIEQADKALYQAKHEGRNRMVMSEPAGGRSKQSLTER